MHLMLSIRLFHTSEAICFHIRIENRTDLAYDVMYSTYTLCIIIICFIHYMTDLGNFPG